MVMLIVSIGFSQVFIVLTNCKERAKNYQNNEATIYTVNEKTHANTVL